MRELGHDRVDLLKMNIEGAEHVVLESAFHASVRPVVVTLTWEGHHALAKARAWTRHLAGENTMPLDLGKVTYVDQGDAQAVRYFANLRSVGRGAAGSLPRRI